ncbi:MAG: esterase [Bacteroidales bacterium]|nr:esterase [Bacteroidales bacterium]
MKKILQVALILVCVFVFTEVSAQEARKFTMKHGGMKREYWLYLPSDIKPDAPLVILLHGYKAKAEGYRPEMMTVAEENGFALCYPQGALDGKGKTCWNVGYPFQEGLKTDDVDFLCTLARHLQKEHDLSRQNTFLTGMSNGGEMCYLMAYLRPDVFTAFAPIAGLSMEWSYRKFDAKKAVPLMEVHGTADKTSRWEGDPSNEGGWGEYLAVPQAVSYWAAQAKCTHEETVEMPLVRNKVIMHRYMGGEPTWKDGPAVEVRLYEVIGGKHTWALNDMDTCREIWNFFSIYLR